MMELKVYEERGVKERGVKERDVKERGVKELGVKELGVKEVKGIGGVKANLVNKRWVNYLIYVYYI